MRIFRYKRLLLFMLLFAFSAEVVRKVRYTSKAISKSLRVKGIELGYSYGLQRNLMVKFREKEKKKFVFVIASYNNEKYCERNLLSVFDQSYDHYRVIYINDCSRDKTVDKVRSFVTYKGQERRVEVIDNPTRVGKMQNLFNAYHSCTNDEIIVCLDGDDALAHSNVLQELNDYYQNPNVWLTYGSAMVMPEGRILKPDWSKDREKNERTMRQRPFDMHMLRTFYAGLFKKLELRDFMLGGDLLPSADDMQVMTSLFEMAPKHALCLDTVNYIINDENPERTSRTNAAEEAFVGQSVTKKAIKPLLHEDFDPRVEDVVSQLSLDALILGSIDVDSIKSEIEKLIKRECEIGKIALFLDTNSQENKEKVFRLCQNYSSVYAFDSKTHSLEDVLSYLSSKYIWLGSLEKFSDNVGVNLKNAILALQKTQALALLLSAESQDPNFKLNVLDDFRVLNTLSDCCTEHYQGPLLASRQALITSLKKHPNEPSLSAGHYFLKDNQHEIFLCQKD